MTVLNSGLELCLCLSLSLFLSMCVKTRKNISKVNGVLFDQGCFCLLGNSYAMQASNMSFFLLKLCLLREPHIAVCLEGTAVLYGVAEGSHFSYTREDEFTFLAEGGRITCLLEKLLIY